MVLTFLRYAVTAFGAGVWMTKHDSELTNLAGLLAALIPSLIGAWKDYKNHKEQQALKVDVVVAKLETAIAKEQTEIVVKQVDAIIEDKGIT